MKKKNKTDLEPTVCALCGKTLSVAPAKLKTVNGWSAYCSPECLFKDMFDGEENESGNDSRENSSSC